MIEDASGNILQADVEALVNTVNCVGFMGRGIALQFKQAFPENFKLYASACARGDVVPGRMLVTETRGLTNPKLIINFPTKRHWRGKSRIEDIEAGLVALTAEIKAREIRSVAVPPLGCGLGGLQWSAVRPRIERALGGLADVRVVLFSPSSTSDVARPVTPPKVPEMTAGRAVLVGLMQHYLGGLMDPFVTLLEVHKLMYFMQEAGEPLRLRYEPGQYGPYAENLRHVLVRIEGYFVSGYSDGGDAPGKPLEIVPGAVDDALRFLAAHPETGQRLDRVAQLVAGFETPFGMELLATVHWVATRGGAEDPEQAVQAARAWSSRKGELFSEDQIKLAWRVLEQGRWLAKASA